MGDREEVPNFATHYHHLKDPPFRNLSDLGPAELAEALEKLMLRQSNEPNNKRVFGQSYMQLRTETEAKMRELFVARGGAPERQHPHYFVLGESAWFAGLYPETGSVRIGLEELDSKAVSFTYPDSFVAMRLGEKYGLPADTLEPYHNRVFFLSELTAVVDKYRLPEPGGGAYDNYHKSKFENYIEIQVWSDEPIADFLDTDRS